MSDNFNLDKGGVKYDAGKLRFDLLPWDVLEEFAYVYTYGAIKYTDRNWEKGMRLGRLIAATFRHITSWMKGETIDAESGCHHLAQAMFGLSSVIAASIRKIGIIDIPTQKDIAIDYDDLWQARNAYLAALSASDKFIPFKQFCEDWDSRKEPDSQSASDEIRVPFKQYYEDWISRKEPDSHKAHLALGETYLGGKDGTAKN